MAGYAISKVSKVQRAEDGVVVRTRLGESGGRRRVSKRYRKVDKALRRVIRAQRTALDEFSGRHERSSARKKNGGLRDLRKNLFKATRKGVKKIKLV